jgi:hypothetical protein
MTAFFSCCQEIPCSVVLHRLGIPNFASVLLLSKCSHFASICYFSGIPTLLLLSLCLCILNFASILLLPRYFKLLLRFSFCGHSHLICLSNYSYFSSVLLLSKHSHSASVGRNYLYFKLCFMYCFLYSSFFIFLLFFCLTAVQLFPVCFWHPEAGVSVCVTLAR